MRNEVPKYPMMNKDRHRQLLIVLVGTFAIALIVATLSADDAPTSEATSNHSRNATEVASESKPVSGSDAATDAQGLVRVGNLVYGNNQTSVCFAEGFLVAVARETDIHVKRTYDTVRLDSADMFSYPMLIFSGEGEFALNEGEVASLADYLTRGGFVLASPGCSNAGWFVSFNKAMREVAPEAQWRTLPMSHPLFHMVYNVETIRLKHPSANTKLRGIFLGDRLAVLFSPQGLNDTAAAGKGCCCCGGNEIRNASQINANVLTYVLTH